MAQENILVINVNYVHNTQVKCFRQHDPQIYETHDLN